MAVRPLTPYRWHHGQNSQKLECKTTMHLKAFWKHPREDGNKRLNKVSHGRSPGLGGLIRRQVGALNEGLAYVHASEVSNL